MKLWDKEERSFGQQLSTILSCNDSLNKKSSDFDLFSSVTLKKVGSRPAAVLLPITFDSIGPAMVFTRRAANLKEHPGQISFPGGKVEERDYCKMDTAVREAFEEICLEPMDVNILGQLPKHDTVTGYTISPFVAVINHYEKLKPNVSEVAEIFKVPLNFLLNAENMLVQSRKLNGVYRSYYVIPYGPYYIWGATARIIKVFSDLVATHEDS